MSRLTRRAVAACLAAALLLPAAAHAQAFPVKFTGFAAGTLRAGPVAVPAYQIAFVTQQQGTASGGVLTKSRLTTTLSNVPEEVMRRLTDEAYADLKAQFQAAGVAMMDDAAVQAAVARAGAERFDNNAEITRIGPTVTIGQGVKKSYAAFGASAAPGIKGVHSPVSTNGVGVGMGFMTLNTKVGPIARELKTVVILPSLVLDFGQTSAAGGRDFLNRETAGVSNKLNFGINAQSQVGLVSSNGRATTPGMMRMPPKDLTVATPFATVATGEGAVRALSVATVVDSNYIRQDAARGDAVIVDLPVWEGLVRQAFKDYNAAIVAEFRKAQK